jgi:hypothetical protein
MPPPKEPIGKEEWLRKQSESHRGKVPWNKGLVGSQVAWNKGKTGIYTEESIRKMSEVKKKKGSLTPEHRKAISDGRKGMRFSESHKANLQKSVLENIPRGENHHCWNGGTSFIPYCYKFNDRRKHAVRSFFGFLCIACGISQDENLIGVKGGGKPVKLAVHHVDHDHGQGCNGRPFNLVPFCNSCHSLEGQHKEEYRLYVDRIIQDGFDWGIWSEQEYMKNVMYEE